MCLVSDSKRIVYGSSNPEKGTCMWHCDGTEVKAWRGMRMPKALDLAEHSIVSLSVPVDSKFFIVSLNSQVHLWDVAGKWAMPLKYTGHEQKKYVIRSCFGGINSMCIASGSQNTQVHIRNRRSPTPIEVLSGHSMIVDRVIWNPIRPLMLASASDDHRIRIWGPKPKQ
ncbi:Detected protein of confused Function [Hibiscus syriacus]|uniref:Detected protein of confused Function n=1 Tax=Hibiscus syriacus TaxID=106335 RepID=A0A6A2YZK5_HIBSY|nr:Detected protein of confused Function [Hibiscus syriacus]